MVPYHADNDVTLRNALFRTIKLTKNADPGKYSCSGCGISFDVRGTFSLPDGEFRKNVIMFGVDMSSSVHVDNKKRYLNSWKRSNTRVRRYFIDYRS